MDGIIEGLERAKKEGRLMEISQESGLHFSTLYRIINREREPQMSTLRKLLSVHPELDPKLAAFLMPEDSSPDDSLQPISEDKEPS